MDHSNRTRLQGEALSKSELWIACQAVSAPISLLVPQASLLPPMPASTLLEPYLHSREQAFAPDNPFILHYAALHHYRSLGWVIKSGVKFCADYLLYKRGPVFSHAECVLSSRNHNIVCIFMRASGIAYTCSMLGACRIG